VSYLPRVAGSHKLHFFFLVSGIAFRMYGGLNPRHLLSNDTASNIVYDWGVEVDIYQDRRSQINKTIDSGYPVSTHFSSHFSGIIQFPSAEEYTLHIDADPDAILVLMIDGVVIFATGFLPGTAAHAGPYVLISVRIYSLRSFLV